MLFLGFGIVGTILSNRRESQEKRKAESIRATKARAAALKKALDSARKAAEKSARAAKAETQQPKRKRGRPRKHSAQLAPCVVQNATEPGQPAPVSKPATFPGIVGNNAFAGQVVSFTGTLPGMTRMDAIQAVENNGGRAFDTMPASTTLLVVGENPGANKLDKADRWIASVRKITAAQFNAMLKQPLTLTPDEFAARFASNE